MIAILINVNFITQDGTEFRCFFYDFIIHNATPMHYTIPYAIQFNKRTAFLIRESKLYTDFSQ